MRVVGVLTLAFLLVSCGGGTSGLEFIRTPLLPVIPAQVPAVPFPSHYQNPLQIQISGGRLIESCADPTIIRAQSPTDQNWYLYCTSDPLYEGSGMHWIPVSRSSDLVNWTYVGDVFTRRPAWVSSDGGIWAPEITFLNNKYYLYYTVSRTNVGAGGSGIFVATSDSPSGPWTANSNPVVEPSGSDNWTYDPEIVEDNGQRYIFFGSFRGGIFARLLSPDGLSSIAPSQVRITTADRYEGAYVTKHDGHFYLMVSASDCCRGPLTGYNVFAARSQNVLGPYLDADGVSMLDPRAGGTPVISMNGNRWLGPGHHTLTSDGNGQEWMIYHAVDVQRPYFNGLLTRRPVLMDPLDWVNGWPTVRGGGGSSEVPQPAPMVGSTVREQYVTHIEEEDAPGDLIASASEEFDGNLAPAWSWVRQPAASSFGLVQGSLRLDTQDAELQGGQALASILTVAAPISDYIVEFKIASNVPVIGTLPFVQSGLVLYKDDANYIKLVTVAIGATRQIEFAKRVSSVQSGYPRYGTSVLAAPGENTFMRIARKGLGSSESYTAYSSLDGVHWRRGSTWIASLGAGARIGLVSMGGSGYTAFFDYVRVYHRK